MVELVTHYCYLIQFDNMHVFKDCKVSQLSIDARSQIFLVFFFHCILAYIYKHGTLLLNFALDSTIFVRTNVVFQINLRKTLAVLPPT